MQLKCSAVVLAGALAISGAMSEAAMASVTPEVASQTRIVSTPQLHTQQKPVPEMVVNVHNHTNEVNGHNHNHDQDGVSHTILDKPAGEGSFSV